MAPRAGSIVAWPKRLGERRDLLSVVVVLVLALSCPSSRAQQPADLQAQVDAAFARLVASLVRIQGYLVYQDQINRVAVATGQLSAADADARLRQKGDELFHRDHADSEMDALVGQHRDQIGAFLGRIRQHVDGSARWPGNASPETYQPTARDRLEAIGRDYDAWMQRRLDPLPLLELAVAIYAWTQGHATPPAGFDPFAGQQERINRALPTAVAQSILLALDDGRSPADAATAAIGQPAAAPPPGPAPIPGLVAPPPPANPTAMPPTLPAVVLPPVPQTAMLPPPGLPGPTVMLPPGAACTHRLGPALTVKWGETGGERGVLGCPVGSEHTVAASPFGTSGSAADFTRGDGGTIVRHDSGSRAGQIFAVHGCNYKLYRQLGGSGGRLGLPISDEYDVPGGRRSDFEGGYITWDARTLVCDAFAQEQPPLTATSPGNPCSTRLTGPASAKWTGMGGVASVLGCPAGPEAAAAPSAFGTTGSATPFTLGDGGTLVRHGSGGLAGQVFAVHGCNYKLYRQLGGSGGRLGFPISDEYDVPGGRRSDFEGGYITWDARTGICNAFAAEQPKPGIVPPSPVAAHTPPTLAVAQPPVVIEAPSRPPAVATSRIRVDDQTFDAAVLRAALPTLVVFCTGWSPPCRDIGPNLDELATALAGQLVVAEIDVDASPTTSRSHIPDALIPTLVLFADGRALASLVGTFSADELADWVDAAVAMRR